MYILQYPVVFLTSPGGKIVVFKWLVNLEYHVYVQLQKKETLKEPIITKIHKSMSFLHNLIHFVIFFSLGKTYKRNVAILTRNWQ